MLKALKAKLTKTAKTATIVPLTREELTQVVGGIDTGCGCGAHTISRAPSQPK